MSKFLAQKHAGLTPYVPGEQPQDKRYVKLNTNESPFSPSPAVSAAIKAFEADRLRLYPDPENRALAAAIAKAYAVKPENVFIGNGSDEVLAFAFMAFFDDAQVPRYPDVSYGFYPVYSELFNLDSRLEILRDDLTLDVDSLANSTEKLVIANPNAPTGIALNLAQIERIVAAKPDRLVIVDEAYVDFGAESAVELTAKYANLLVVQTTSKSRALAGLRVGYAIAQKPLIDDLKLMKFSFNSYNVNRLSEVAATAAFEDSAYFDECRAKIIDNRAYFCKEARALGFVMPDSAANFVFLRHDKIDGSTLYLTLKDMGYLVRHFDKQKITDYVRVTIGTREQMSGLLGALKQILSERG